MKYIRLNNTDLNISPICLGTAGFGDKSDLEKALRFWMPLCRQAEILLIQQMYIVNG